MDASRRVARSQLTMTDALDILETQASVLFFFVFVFVFFSYF